MTEDAKEMVPAAEGETASEAEKAIPVARVVPLHEVPGIKARRGRGRPRKIEMLPDSLAYHAEMAMERAKFIDADEVVKAAVGRKDGPEVLQKVKEEVAKESASLHFTRIELEKYGKDTTQVSRNRVSALREVANIELEMRKLGANFIDVKSENFQKIFGFFIECIKEAAIEVLTTEQVDLLFNRLEVKIDGWEEKVQNMIR